MTGNSDPRTWTKPGLTIQQACTALSVSPNIYFAVCARVGNRARGWIDYTFVIQIPLKFWPARDTKRGKRYAYPTIHRPDHPRASGSGVVYLHLLAAEMALGRALPPGAEVHHRNEDPADYRQANLVICQDRQYHKLLHVRMRILRAGGNPNTDAVCRVCRLAKPRTAFAANRGNRSTGVQNTCRACRRGRS